MNIRQSPDFYAIYKSLNVRIRNQFDKILRLFIKNPLDPQLNNHELHDRWKGYRCIDITSDYRAIYEELTDGDEPVAYFIAIGTHLQLYGN